MKFHACNIPFRNFDAELEFIQHGAGDALSKQIDQLILTAPAIRCRPALRTTFTFNKFTD